MMMTDKDNDKVMASSSSSSPSQPPIIKEKNKSNNALDASTSTAAAEPTTTTTTTMTKKFLVPSSDRRLALSAIDNRLHSAKDAWAEENFNSDKQRRRRPCNTTPTNDLASTARGEFFLNCIHQTGDALHRQLELVTAPAEEAELESVLDSFRTRLATATLRTSSGTNKDCRGDDDEDEEVSSSSSEDEDFEFDDAEIVDDEAYHQAKRLRARARHVASRVSSVREETVRRAVEMTQRNLAELMRVHGFDNDDDDSQDEDGSGYYEHQANVGDGVDYRKERSSNNNNNNGTDDALNPLRMAIQTLASSLKHVDYNLTDNLESLKDTIGTIDSSVDKIQRRLRGDESALSRTEKALLASSGANNPEEEDTGVVMGEAGIVAEFAVQEAEMMTAMNPDKKLAYLLAG